jgi:SAM-dependent methyltransferase
MGAMGAREDATRESYDRIAEDYAATFFTQLNSKPLDRALLRLLAEEAPGQLPVADVGCGPGHVARHLHSLGRRTLGIDLSARMIAVARQRTPEVCFQVGNMLALDAPDGAWGGIVAFYSIIHLGADELPGAFSELYRVLVPGGLLLLAFGVSPPSGVPGVEVDGDTIHAQEFLGHKVSLHARILEVAAVCDQLERAGLVVEASLSRRPYPQVEEAAQRAYLLARKPGHHQTS